LFSLNASTKELKNAERLSKDRDFLLRLHVIEIAKYHNLYGCADKYMRQFARICDGLRAINRGDIAEQLEEVLNSELSIEITKLKPLSLSKSIVHDYQTVHPNIIARPEFPFLPASFKLQRVNEHIASKD